MKHKIFMFSNCLSTYMYVYICIYIQCWVLAIHWNVTSIIKFTIFLHVLLLLAEFFWTVWKVYIGMHLCVFVDTFHLQQIFFDSLRVHMLFCLFPSNVCQAGQTTSYLQAYQTRFPMYDISFVANLVYWCQSKIRPFCRKYQNHAKSLLHSSPINKLKKNCLQWLRIKICCLVWTIAKNC